MFSMQAYEEEGRTIRFMLQHDSELRKIARRCRSLLQMYDAFTNYVSRKLGDDEDLEIQMMVRNYDRGLALAV